MSPVLLAVIVGVVALVIGWFVGSRSRPEPVDRYSTPLARLQESLLEGRLGVAAPDDPPGVQQLRDAVSESWAPRNEEREEALKQALGRVAAFLEESVEGPLRTVRDGDRDLLREGVDRALGGLKDLEFFLREPITPDETHNLVPLVQQVVREFIADWEVAVRLQAPPSPVRAHIHRDTFMDALYLLLHNAREFGEAKRIDVRVEDRDGHAELVIRDQGPGFSDEALQRAKDLFYTTKPSSLGLGIPFARKIVEGFGGNLELDNDPQGGARVRLTIPGA